MLPSAPAPLSSKAVVGTPIAEDAMPFRYERRVHDRGLFMVEALRKRSEDVLDYHLDFTHWLESGETVESARAWVEPMGAPTPGDLFVFKAQFGDSGALIWLANGADGGRALVYVRVGTSGGRFKLVRFVVFTRGVPTDLVFFSGDADVTVGGNTGPIDPPPVVDPTKVLTRSPASLIFAALDIGDVSVPQDVTLTNAGTATLSVSAIVVTGDFELQANNQTGSALVTPLTLAPGDTATIKVAFAPTIVGTRAGSLAISSDAGNLAVALSGVANALPAFNISNAGIASDGPFAFVSATSLTFPDTVI